MITNLYCTDKSSIAFGRGPAINKRSSSSVVSWQKLLGDIEALPKQDTRLGRLIRNDELYHKTLCDRKVRVEPERVREFFQYLASTLDKKNIQYDKRPFPQRLEDLALFVKKVLCTIQEKRRRAEKIAGIIANYNNESI